jgi:hypothetical protein
VNKQKKKNNNGILFENTHIQQEVSHLHGVKLDQFPDQLREAHSSFDISLFSDSMAGTSDSSIIAVCSVYFSCI